MYRSFLGFVFFVLLFPTFLFAQDLLPLWTAKASLGPSTNTITSDFKNLYAAVAVDLQYKQDCDGEKNSLLCDLWHSAVVVSGNLRWRPADQQAGANNNAEYAILLVPFEKISGKIAKEGLDLETSPSAAYYAWGVRSTLWSDPDLKFERRTLSGLNGSYNVSLPIPTARTFRVIGSVRMLLGATSTQLTNEATTVYRPAMEIEYRGGLAIDLIEGSIILGFGQDYAWERGFTALSSAKQSLTKVELKYIRYWCRDEKRGGCKAPHVMDYSAKLQYTDAAFSVAGTPPLQTEVQRLGLILELKF